MPADDALNLRETAWAGHLFLDSGQMLYAGPVGPTDAHAHHAFQVVLALEGQVTLSGSDAHSVVACTVAIIPPDTEHRVVVGCPSALMLYVDPDGIEGRRLRGLEIGRDAPATWQLAGNAMRQYGSLASPRDWTTAQQRRTLMLEALIGPGRRPQACHPALVRAVRELPRRLDHSLRLGTLARELGISESRLGHLFGEELGLPFRTYVAWLRVRAAAGAVQAGSTLAAAAYSAGFADAAHLTRTFRRMFGIVPSHLTGVVRWVGGPGAATISV